MSDLATTLIAATAIFVSGISLGWSIREWLLRRYGR